MSRKPADRSQAAGPKPADQAQVGGSAPDGPGVIATKLSPGLEREINRRIRKVVLAHLEVFAAAVQDTLDDPRNWKDGQAVTFVGRISKANRLRDPFTNRPTGGSIASVWIRNRYVVQVVYRPDRFLLDHKGRRVRIEGTAIRGARWEWPTVDVGRVMALDDPSEDGAP